MGPLWATSWVLGPCLVFAAGRCSHCCCKAAEVILQPHNIRELLCVVLFVFGHSLSLMRIGRASALSDPDQATTFTSKVFPASFSFSSNVTLATLWSASFDVPATPKCQALCTQTAMLTQRSWNCCISTKFGMTSWSFQTSLPPVLQEGEALEARRGARSFLYSQKDTKITDKLSEKPKLLCHLLVLTVLLTWRDSLSIPLVIE